MRLFVYAAVAAFGTLGAASSASATLASVAYGSPLAVACYRAAEDHEASDLKIQSCTLALRGDGIAFDDMVATYVNRGVLYLLKGRNEAAHRDFDAAIKLRHDMAEAWVNKGVARLNEGKAAEAMDFAQKALDLQIENQALAYFVRGLAREDQGRIEQAYADLRKAQELAPKWAEPQIELARYKVVVGS